MFSFPRPGCVQTGTSGYAYVLDARSGESYIFVRDLAVGSQSKVQLVANILTKEVVVRKVHEDRVVRILDHLNSIILNPVSQPPSGFTPRWTTCLSHESIPVMSGGPRPRMESMRVSYWKLCNAGYLGEWARSWRAGSPSKGYSDAPFPVSIIARCISQVCQTLHIMYQAGPEPVYHCDLHNANIFIHFDDPSNPTSLPDFYIGDFGWSRTASESRADGIALYGTSTIKNEPTTAVLSQYQVSSPPPGVVPPHQRRVWDVTRFVQGLDLLVSLATPAAKQKKPNEQVVGLHRLMKMIQFIDEQEHRLAATNPRSRPASLVEIVREATKLEQAALVVEKGTEAFRAFMAARRRVAREMVEEKKVFVFTDGKGEERKKRAERFGREHLEGGWSLVESV